jgi:hypothetical protein
MSEVATKEAVENNGEVHGERKAAAIKGALAITTFTAHRILDPQSEPATSAAVAGMITVVAPAAWEHLKNMASKRANSFWESTEGLRTSISGNFPVVTTRERVETAEEQIMRLESELKQSRNETWAVVAVATSKGMRFEEIDQGIDRVSDD